MPADPRKSEAGVHESESAFHDGWAGQTDLAAINVREAFEAVTSPENRFILRKMGELRGKQILDIGAGLGESSVYFALQGAEVTAVDISPGMIELGQRLAARHAVRVRGVVSHAESLNVEEGRFDFVYAGNLLHHVTDRSALYDQILRALKPGGTFFSWDPIAYNPIINIYRRMATRVRTEDERPLTFEDIRQLRRRFGAASHREFWITTLSLFLKYYLIDRVHPNEDRYWKRILREDPAKLGWFKALQKLDSVLARLPLIRRLAWNTVIWARKPN